MQEDEVKNAVIPYLASHLNYRPTRIRTKTEHGVDIVARHVNYPRYFLVEVKGDPPETAKYRNSGREVRFLQALGQMMTRIHPDRGYRYGLAFPDSYKELVVRRIHPALLKKLHIHLFFVGTGRKVEHLRWKDLESRF